MICCKVEFCDNFKFEIFTEIVVFFLGYQGVASVAIASVKSTCSLHGCHFTVVISRLSFSSLVALGDNEICVGVSCVLDIWGRGSSPFPFVPGTGSSLVFTCIMPRQEIMRPRSCPRGLGGGDPGVSNDWCIKCTRK